MAHYHQGNPLPPTPRGQQPQHYRHGSYGENLEESSAQGGFGTNGIPYDTYSSGNSAAARQNAELFMAPDSQPPPPPPPRRNPGSASGVSYNPQSPHVGQASYNPQSYAYSSLPTAFPGLPASPSVHRRPSAGGSPQPYNPADYVDSHVQRSSSTASYPSQSFSNTAMPNPSFYQAAPPASRSQSLHGGRPTVQTSYPHYTAPAPPPLPAIPGSAGDSPSDDWRQVPSVTRYSSRHHRPVPSNSTSSPPLPPLPQQHHRRTSTTSSGGPSYDSNPASPGFPPPPPPHGSSGRTSGVDSHPYSRPLPRLPSGAGYNQSSYFPDRNGNSVHHHRTSESSIQDDLEQQIMSRIGATPSPAMDEANGSVHSSGSDQEALAGLQAMQEAERQEAEDEARRQSGTMFYGNRQPSRREQTKDSDSDVPYDLSAMGGGWDAHMSYGGGPNQLMARNGSLSDAHNLSQTVSSSGSQRRSGNVSDVGEHERHNPASARVDASGTGGLADPRTSGRRLSFDEGDEQEQWHMGEPPEIFYHPGMTNRPLPPPPRGELAHSHSSSAVPYPTEWRSEHVNVERMPSYPSASQPPNRHTSLVTHTVSPQALTPARARTDADDRKKPRHASDSSGNNTANASAVTLDLPSVNKRYVPSKLNHRDFDRCREPWALSALTRWLKALVIDEQYLKKQSLVDGLVALFTHKVHTMNIADAETLADRIVDQMQADGTLVQEEEWLVFTHVAISGVLFQLTGSGCYAPMLHCNKHDNKTSGRCYAHLCQRTEKKIDLSTQPEMAQDVDWQNTYSLSLEKIEAAPKREVERQNILHELVQKEENYVRELTFLLEIYRDGLRNANPPVLTPKRLPRFIQEVFGKAEAVRKVNEEHFLPQIKYRQKEQGPWIVGFSDILREWIRKAKTAYTEYASAYPSSIFKVRQETERNMLFKTFIDDCRNHKRSRKLGYDHFLKLPISRLQQLGLLLETALKKSEQDNDEKRNLHVAIEEIKAVTHECDARVGEGLRKVELESLGWKLKLRPEMMKVVELNLDHLGRELVHQGELLRTGNTRFGWVETRAILFDHYLVLAKTSIERGADGTTKYERYDVSRLPIPMDLLVLESRDDDPVIKSTLAGVTKLTPVMNDKSSSKMLMKDSMGAGLQHTATSTSLNSIASSKSAPPIITSLDGGKDDRLYPFRLKHLGKETYTLFAPSFTNREEWCSKIVEAKTKHASALFAQNAEPFKLRVVADCAFAYEGGSIGQKGIVIRGTPLDRAIREVEDKYATKGRPTPVCRAKVNCATSFRQTGPGGHPSVDMLAVGTDYGVYVSEANNPRGWQRVINNVKVTQIAVLEEFSLFLLITDKSLIAYHLDVVCPLGGVPQNNDSARKAPQKLSGNRDIGFFATGRMKDRTLVIYKKRDGISSTFKVITVLEPVLQKSTERKSRFPPLRSGRTEFFRDFDEFYIPTECMGMNMFHSSIAISSSKGFEILNLDKKNPMSIPPLEDPSLTAIAQKLQGQKPLGMFRLSEQEFLLCYEDCAVYVDKHGEISRSVIMEFVGKARTATLFGPYVLLFDQDFVEIRNAMNGRLRQVIAGRDIKCLDDARASAGPIGQRPAPDARCVKVSMQHPEMEKLQLVVELVLNEGMRDD